MPMPDGISGIAEDADVEQACIKSREVAVVKIQRAKRNGGGEQQDPDD